MIPLHVHSNFTFLSTTIPVEQLIQQARQYNLSSLAITDTNGMYGAIRFAKSANEKNIKPIIGSLITEPENENCSVIFLAKNENGYSDLCKIITSRKLNDDFSLFKLLSGSFPDLFIISCSIELLKHTNKSNEIFIELISSKNEKKNNKERFTFAEQNHIRYVVTNPV